jgi:hypothetical protein
MRHLSSLSSSYALACCCAINNQVWHHLPHKVSRQRKVDTTATALQSAAAAAAAAAAAEEEVVLAVKDGTAWVENLLVHNVHSSSTAASRFSTKSYETWHTVLARAKLAVSQVCSGSRTCCYI